jgi:hypothetical protein
MYQIQLKIYEADKHLQKRTKPHARTRHHKHKLTAIYGAHVRTNAELIPIS